MQATSEPCQFEARFRPPPEPARIPLGGGDLDRRHRPVSNHLGQPLPKMARPHRHRLRPRSRHARKLSNVDV